MYAAPAYWLYEMSQAALNPSRAFADAARLFYRNPANPLSYTTFGKTMAAGLELFERSTRRYGKPDWDIDSTVVGGERVPVRITTVWERPFCRLLHFERSFGTAAPAAAAAADRGADVGPLRHPAARHGRGFLPNHDVYITEWVDARMVPVSEGRFDLDDYIDYVDLHAALAGRRYACDRGVPAFGAGAGRGRADGGRGRSLCRRIPWC